MFQNNLIYEKCNSNNLGLFFFIIIIFNIHTHTYTYFLTDYDAQGDWKET